MFQSTPSREDEIETSQRHGFSSCPSRERRFGNRDGMLSRGVTHSVPRIDRIVKDLVANASGQASAPLFGTLPVRCFDN
jgi:hypothetical protein